MKLAGPIFLPLPRPSSPSPLLRPFSVDCRRRTSTLRRRFLSRTSFLRRLPLPRLQSLPPLVDRRPPAPQSTAFARRRQASAMVVFLSSSQALLPVSCHTSVVRRLVLPFISPRPPSLSSPLPFRHGCRLCPVSWLRLSSSTPLLRPLGRRPALPPLPSPPPCDQASKPRRLPSPPRCPAATWKGWRVEGTKGEV